MRTLKNVVVVYTYKETFCLKGHFFEYEWTTEDITDKNNGIYALYDINEVYSHHIIAYSITTYDGLLEIAEAYLKGDKKALLEAKRKWCMCY